MMYIWVIYKFFTKSYIRQIKYISDLKLSLYQENLTLKYYYNRS